MRNEKNQVVELNRAQTNPYEALPQDFTIQNDGQEHFHGQHDAKLLKVREGELGHGKSKVTGEGQQRATRPDDAGESHTGRATK